MKVTQISIGRFHHFHLARQMEKHGLLESIWTGYPLLKLRDEKGIPKNKIRTFPWLHTPYMARGRVGLNKWKWLNQEWAWQAHETLDKKVARGVKEGTALIALSSSGLYAGKVAQRIGGHHICDRGSSHIRFQNQILEEEYARWGLDFSGIDSRIIHKEEAEYEQADFITIPSEFVRKTFIRMGVPENKLIKIPYGARLERFSKIADPPRDAFRVLWVGNISLRKGFFDLLRAFSLFKHPAKELLVVGSISDEVKAHLSKFNLKNVIFKGVLPNDQLASLYSSSHAFVLSSIEEGLAMVQGEALACGCPVIATDHTGAADLFDDGTEGFIVPIRSPEVIREKLNELAEDEYLRERMSEAALKRVQKLGGWDTYGNQYASFVRTRTNTSVAF